MPPPKNKLAKEKALRERYPHPETFCIVSGFVPNPAEYRVVVHRGVDMETRRVWKCEAYDHCLNYAAANRWISFSCRACDVWSYLTPDRKRRIRKRRR